MKQILEYIISKSTKRYVIKATNNTIKQIVKDELDKLGHDADLNHIDVSEVQNMNSLFSCYSEDLGEEYEDLNPDISKWNVSKVENMWGMFYNCKKFNQDISRWDVGKVEDMYCMFYRCINFNQNISNWDVRKVKNTQFMFKGCKNFNQDLSRWALSTISSTMFEDCPIKEEYKS